MDENHMVEPGSPGTGWQRPQLVSLTTSGAAEGGTLNFLSEGQSVNPTVKGGIKYGGYVPPS